MSRHWPDFGSNELFSSLKCSSFSWISLTIVSFSFSKDCSKLSWKLIFGRDIFLPKMVFIEKKNPSYGSFFTVLLTFVTQIVISFGLFTSFLLWRLMQMFAYSSLHCVFLLLLKMVSESSSTFIWLFLISKIVIQFEFKSDFDLTLWYRIVNHEMSFSIDSKYCYSFNAFKWQKKIQFGCISESTSINKSDIKWKQNWKTEDLSNSQRPFAFFTVNKKSIHIIMNESISVWVHSSCHHNFYQQAKRASRRKKTLNQLKWSNPAICFMK